MNAIGREAENCLRDNGGVISPDSFDREVDIYRELAKTSL
jgi:hypothetical protein